MTYRLFGLVFASSFRFSILTPLDAPSDADVTLSEGDVPDHLGDASARGAMFEAAPGRFLLTIPSVARFLIEDGRSIRVARGSATDDDVQAFVLGSVLGILLTQRGALVLHAAVVDSPRGAVLFAAHSGRGKSTLAAAFARRGWPVLSDDLAPVSREASGAYVVTPGGVPLKLWPDTARAMGWEDGDWPKVRDGAAKRWAPVRPDPEGRPRRVRAIFVLRPHAGSGIEITPQSGAGRFAAIRFHTCNRLAFEKAGVGQRLFPPMLGLAAQAPVFDVRRPRRPMLVEPLADAIMAALAETGDA